MSTSLLSFVEDNDWNKFRLGGLKFEQCKSESESMADLDDVVFIARKFYATYIDYSGEWCLVDFDVANYTCLFVKFEFVHTSTINII